MNAIVASEWAPAPWTAELRLRYAREGGRTVLRDRAHRGPLRVLKTLYPEGDAVAHTVLVHPPAGIAGGDILTISCALDAGTHAVVATPGAQKWYRSHEVSRQMTARVARASTTIGVAADACLEWLPQEAIVYDHCNAEQTITFALDVGSKLIAWEMLVWGRTAMGEQFDAGRFAQRIALTRGGVPLWTEQMAVQGGDTLLRSPVGYGGMPASANLWITGAQDVAACITALRVESEACAQGELVSGVSCVAGDLIVVKAVAQRIELLRTFLVRCRVVARPMVCALVSVPLRIWST
jgi:urease accessory protein